MSDKNGSQASYSPDVKKSKGISPLWLLPVLTMVLAGWLVFKSVHDAGQSVQIYFSEAAGLIPGRTTIRYQGLEVGMVRNISLSQDLSNIYVDADIYPDATKLLNDKTRFWLVKPTASLSGVSGLDALVSGNYIAIQPGDSQKFETTFHALNSAPRDLKVNQGLNIQLKSRDLGGISIGSQIVYKKIPIGEIYNYQLDKDAKSVTIQANIEEQYRHIINDRSRFWNVSGLGANIGFNGVDVKLESMNALLSGAIAVDSPDDGEPVKENSEFHLYKDLQTAGRGIAIKIALPDDNNISGKGAPIMYRGIEVGQITDLKLSEDNKVILASAAIQPAFSDMLTVNTRFVLEEAKVSLSGVENITNLVRGNFLTIVPNKGKSTRQFTAIRKSVFNQQQEKSIAIRLVSNNSYGLDSGANLLYKGVVVGSVIKVGLQGTTKQSNNEVFMDVLVDHEYKHLLKSNNRFYVTGSASAELTESGLSITVPPAKQLLTGSISFVSQGKNTVKDEYQLFQSASLAEIAQYNQTGSKTLTLFTKELPSISKGSPLLYRNLPVGSVSDFSLVNDGVIVKVTIENRYAYLVGKQTVFWNRSGVEIDASMAGIRVKADPIRTLIQGGIAFDTIEGVENKIAHRWKLYNNQSEARQFGKTITLLTNGTQEVSEGTPIQYQGIKVGEVTSVSPDFKQDSMKVQAHLYPQYVDDIAVTGSHFWLASPQIGISGVKNLDALVSKSISVKPGNGNSKFQFDLANTDQSQQGIGFILQSEQRGSVQVGTPILYRQMDVGTVTDIQLGEFADRVMIQIEVLPQFAYLVRQNSVFWNISGVDVSFGLSGASIRSGTVESLVRGGIAFATPEQSNLKPIAEAGKTFYLNPQAEEDWTSWQTPIPKP